MKNPNEAAGWLVFALGAVFMLALLLLFYPRATVAVDENRHLSVAYYLRNGRAFDRSSEAWFWKPRPDDLHLDRTLFGLSPAFSTLLIPFVAVGWRSAFLLPTLAHVLAFGGMIVLFRRRGLNPFWAMLYLLYPPLVLYSRMVMSDVPSASLMVLVLVCLHREKPSYVLGGLVMGFACLVKISNFPVVGAFFLVTLVKDAAGLFAGARRMGLGSAAMAVGMLPGFAALAAVNARFFNSPLGTAYVGVGGGMFAWAYFVQHLPFYAFSLMVAYPFMLLSPIFLKEPLRWEMRIACLVTLAFFGSYYYIDPGNNLAEAVVRGLRFQLVVMPFYMIAYADMIVRAGRIGRLAAWRRPVLAAGAVALCAAAPVLCWRAWDYAGKEAVRHDELESALPGRGTVVVAAMTAKYVNVSDVPGLRVRLVLASEELPYEVRADDLPALLVLADPDAVRTVAWREDARRDHEQILARAKDYFDLREADSRVAGFDLFVLERRHDLRERPWSPLRGLSLLFPSEARS